MAFQKDAIITLAIGSEGDLAGKAFYTRDAYLVTDVAGLNIGKFAWKVINTESDAVQAKGANTTLAGFVVRNNTNVNATQGITTIASMNIRQGQSASIAHAGDFIVKIQAVEGANPVAQSSAVYIDNVTGGIIADGGGTMTAYTKTNFLFDSPSADLVVGGLVKISNVNNVMGV